MIALPLGEVEAFEEWLRWRWHDPCWYVARGSLAVSFGLLGLRWVEVERMEPGDLLVDACSLFVRTAKRGRPRTIDAPGELLGAAVAMRAGIGGGDDRVFVTKGGRGMVYQDVRRFVRGSTRRVFGRAFSFHCFRHTAAVRCYERTRDVVAVQRLLGHKSLQWTNSYLQSLMVHDIGGPVAFAGGGKARRPRVFDPDGLGCVRAVRAVAARGKAAAAGDLPLFEVDREAESGSTPGKSGSRILGKSGSTAGKSGAVAELYRRLEERIEAGMSLREAAELFNEERDAIAGEELAVEEARRKMEEEEREEVVRRRVSGPCRHTELRERWDKAGRHWKECKLCGRWYGYVGCK